MAPGMREACEKAVETARETCQAASKQAGELGSRIQDLELRLQQMGDLQDQLGEARTEHRTYQTLHSMLDARGLKQHVANQVRTIHRCEPTGLGLTVRQSGSLHPGWQSRRPLAIGSDCLG